MTTSAGRFVGLNYSDLAQSFSEMKSGSWLKTNLRIHVHLYHLLKAS